MVSHAVPRSVTVATRQGEVAGDGNDALACLWAAVSAEGVMARDRASRRKERDGPVRVQFHVAPRRKGARLDSGAIPCSARPRWVRRFVLLPDTGSTGARCRRQCPPRGDRGADRALLALFGRARGLCGGA